MDIFLIDAVPDDDRAYDQLVRRVRTCSRRCYLSQRKLVLRKGQLVKDLCLALVSLPYKLFCPASKAIRKLDRVSASYESNPTKRAGIFMDTFNQKESTLTREQWADTVEMEFEGEEFTAPACYDELLRRTYGDYMQLPPKEQQVTHHDFDITWREREAERAGR